MKILFLNRLYRKFVDAGGVDVFDVPNDYSFKEDFDLYFLSAYNKLLSQSTKSVSEKVYDMHFNVAIRLNLLGVVPEVSINESILYFKKNHQNKNVDEIVGEIHAMVLKTGGYKDEFLEIEIEKGSEFDMPQPQNPRSLFVKSKQYKNIT